MWVLSISFKLKEILSQMSEKKIKEWINLLNTQIILSFGRFPVDPIHLVYFE